MSVFCGWFHTLVSPATCQQSINWPMTCWRQRKRTGSCSGNFLLLGRKWQPRLSFGKSIRSKKTREIINAFYFAVLCLLIVQNLIDFVWKILICHDFYCYCIQPSWVLLLIIIRTTAQMYLKQGLLLFSIGPPNILMWGTPILKFKSLLSFIKEILYSL